MAASILERISVVAGLAYIERVRALPAAFTARLEVERDNRYLPFAIAVVAGGGKVGYVAPEISKRYYEPLAAWTGEPLTCPGRAAADADRESSGVELLLDFSGLPLQPAE